MDNKKEVLAKTFIKLALKTKNADQSSDSSCETFISLEAMARNAKAEELFSFVKSYSKLPDNEVLWIVERCIDSLAAEFPAEAKSFRTSLNRWAKETGLKQDTIKRSKQRAFLDKKRGTTNE